MFLSGYRLSSKSLQRSSTVPSSRHAGTTAKPSRWTMGFNALIVRTSLRFTLTNSCEKHYAARLEEDEAAADAEGYCFGAGGCAEFAEDGGYVEFGGVVGDVEAGGGFLVGWAGGLDFLALRG